MAQLTLGRREVWQVVEQGHIGRGRVVHGTFDRQEEAHGRYLELLRAQPALATPGVCWVEARYVEVLEPVEPTEGGR